jgi:hypothetical protein
MAEQKDLATRLKMTPRSVQNWWDRSAVKNYKTDADMTFRFEKKPQTVRRKELQTRRQEEIQMTRQTKLQMRRQKLPRMMHHNLTGQGSGTFVSQRPPAVAESDDEWLTDELSFENGP